MNQKTLGTRLQSGTLFREAGGEQPRPPTFALETESHRAIDLSCRACGAMAMGAGLGFPVGVSAPLRFHPQPPTHEDEEDEGNEENEEDQERHEQEDEGDEDDEGDERDEEDEQDKAEDEQDEARLGWARLG